MENFVAIDIETATEKRSSICQIGITEVIDGNPQPSKSWYVQPENNEYNPINIAIHGITPEVTKNSPLFPVVWKEIEPYLQNKIVVAHNTSFDMYALRDAFDLYRIEYPTFDYFCTLRIARYVIHGCYCYSLDVLLDYLHIEFSHHHDAGFDSLGCAQLLLRCLDIEACDIFTLETKYNFHRGKFAPNLFVSQLSNGKPQESYKTFINSIIANKELLDENNYFYGKSVCFTGTCRYGIRKNLLQKVADIGGIPMDQVTADTDVLVVGQQDYRRVGQDGMSAKQEKAMKMLAKGKDIEILSESEFFERI